MLYWSRKLTAYEKAQTPTNQGSKNRKNESSNKGRTKIQKVFNNKTKKINTMEQLKLNKESVLKYCLKNFSVTDCKQLLKECERAAKKAKNEIFVYDFNLEVQYDFPNALKAAEYIHVTRATVYHAIKNGNKVRNQFKVSRKSFLGA